MSAVGLAAAATTNLALPALQALATISLLKYQKEQYDDLSEDRIKILCECLNDYVTKMKATIDSGLFTEGYGTVPTAAEFVSVDALAEQCATINENLQNVPSADRLMAAVNLLNRNDDLARMVFFCPAFLNNMHKVDRQIKDLVDGKLPIDSAIDVLTSRAEQDALNGRAGNCGKLVARDLGVNRLAMQARGLAMLQQQAGLVQAVSPHQNRMTIQDMMVKPEFRLGYALTQNQLIQNSLQNKYNLDAAGDPTAFAKIQTELQLIGTELQVCAQKASLLNAFVPDYASLLSPQIKSITGALMGNSTKTSTQSGNESEVNRSAASSETDKFGSPIGSTPPSQVYEAGVGLTGEILQN